MKKILQIAKYDFRRIAFNPITLIGYAIIIVACLILGFVYKIPNTPAYKASLYGETTREVYSSFTSADEKYDTKQKLDKIFEDAQFILNIHDTSCGEADQLVSLNHSLQDIWTKVDTYHKWQGHPNQPQPPSKNEIANVVNQLDIFVENFKNIEQFRTRLILTTTQVKDLTTTVKFFKNVLNNNEGINEVMNKLYEGKSHFTNIKQISAKAITFNVDTVHLSDFQNNYIIKAKAKLEEIFKEMTEMYLSTEPSDVSRLKKMKSLATNYKLTCESAKGAIEREFSLLLDKLSVKINKLYGYEKFSLEETKRDLSFAKYFLADDELYYTAYQQALNFNTASYKTTAYDHAYFMMAIIGFLTVLFGIFGAYKLFGRDRRNGKMDLILSQKVSFNQVFVGKFLAILWSTSFCVLVFGLLTFAWGAIFYGFLPGSIIAVFNTNKVYMISPFLFFLIKLIGIELQAIFYIVLTLFMMNISRKFDLTFAITIVIFVAATICNILLNNQLWWCLLPFMHADITSFLGGGSMSTGFLKTSLFAYGNFFITLIYYVVLVGLLFTFTKQLFKKN